jgi:small subunit ribosomal protein S8
MADRLSEAINAIKTNEHIGRQECTIRSTKLVKAVIDVMVRSSYITGYEEFDERYKHMMKISLANKINEIGVIKPRLAVTNEEIQDYESRFIPSKDFGILIVSTSQGIFTNKEAKEKGIGGRLLAYVF